MGSSYYQSKIDELNAIIVEISSVFDEFDDCINVVNKLLGYKVDELTVDGKSIIEESSSGDVITMTGVFTELSDDKIKLEEIIDECDEKIVMYTKLRDEALAREKAENNSLD